MAAHIWITRWRSRRDEILPLLVVAGAAAYFLGTQFVLGLPFLLAAAGLLAAGVGMVILVRPFWGFLGFVALVTVEYIFVTGSPLTLTKAFGGLVLFSWAISAAVRRHYHLPKTILWGWIVLYLATAGISLLAAENTSGGLARIGTMLQLALFTLVTATILRRSRDVAWVGWTYIGSLGLACMFGIAQALRTGQVLRGFVGDRNNMGILIALAIPIVFYFLPRVAGPARMALFGLLGVFVIAEGFSYSRMGFLSMGVAFVLSLLTLMRRGRVRILVVVVLIASMAVVLLPGTYWDRVGGITRSVGEGSDTVGLRYQLWQISLRMIEDHPVLGVGPGNYFHHFMRYGGIIGLRRDPLSAHNTYLGVSAELGLIGGSFFVLILGTGIVRSLATARRAARQAQNDVCDLSLTYGSCLLIYSLGMLSMNAESSKMFWILIGVSAALGSLGVTAETPVLDQGPPDASSLAQHRSGA